MESQVSGVATSTATLMPTEGRVTTYGWKALAGSVIGYSMDGFDMRILGFMLAAISAELRFTSIQAGSLVTWTLAGAVAGGVMFGALSDHYGQIRVLTWTILVFAAFTGLCAFRTTLGIALVCAVQNFTYYGMMIWMASYLAHSLGFSLTKSGMWASVTVLGMVLGILTFGQLADRIGRKPVFALYSIAAACRSFSIRG